VTSDIISLAEEKEEGLVVKTSRMDSIVDTDVVVVALVVFIRKKDLLGRSRDCIILIWPSILAAPLGHIYYIWIVCRRDSIVRER